MAEPAHDLDSLAALVEGRLDAGARQRVLAHLADCADCRGTAAELGRAVADGTLGRSRRLARLRVPMKSARLWLPVAASVLIGTFAWFQFASYPSQPVGPGEPRAQPGIDPSADDLLRRRSAGRKVGDKTFRMSGGEWIDASFDPALGLPIVVIRGAQERAAVLGRVPELTPYAALGNRVVVTWQGTVYRFE